MKPKEKGIRPEKIAIDMELKEHVSHAAYMIIADYTGMDMPATTSLKDSLNNSGARFSVVKNRMLARSIDSNAIDLLKGQSAMIYGDGDVVEVAKIINKFRKENEVPLIKGGIFEGKSINAEEVEELAKLPSKEVLYSMLVGTLQAPMSQVVGVMNNKVSSLVYVLEAARNKKEM